MSYFCSVAIATYNGEKYIAQQLDSILSQSHSVDEIVVCDDCSTDNTISIVNDYKNKYEKIKWTVKINEKNMGYSLNFKQSISNCSGDLIFLCDQDDIWHPDKVKQLVKVFKENKNATSVVTDFKTIGSNGEFLKNKDEKENIWLDPEVAFSDIMLYNIKLREILGHNWAPGCTQVIKKSIVEEYINLKTKMVHDWCLNIISAFNGGCYYLKEPLTFYRIHNNNTIGMSSGLNVKKNKKIINRIFDFLKAVKNVFFSNEKMGSENLLNLPFETLKMIEDEVKCESPKTQKELLNYKRIAKKYTDCVQKRKLFKYLYLRVTQKDFFNNQVHTKYGNEKNTKLMKDLRLIIRKV